MGATWWSYGKGLLGPDASWAPVSGQTVLQTTAAINELRCTQRSRRRRPPTRIPPRLPQRCIEAVRHRWLEEAGVVVAVVPAGGRRRRHAPRRVRCAGQRRVPGRQRVRQGRRTVPQLFNGKVDFLAFFHKPHYAVVEVAPLVKQRDEPGRAPAKPEIDTTRPHQYVYMIRDLGAKRKPAGFITVGSLAVFLMLCYLLHTRDRACSRTDRRPRSRENITSASSPVQAT